MESLQLQFVDLVKMAVDVDGVTTFGDFNTMQRKPTNDR